MNQTANEYYETERQNKLVFLQAAGLIPQTPVRPAASTAAIDAYMDGEVSDEQLAVIEENADTYADDMHDYNLEVDHYNDLYDEYLGDDQPLDQWGAYGPKSDEMAEAVEGEGGH